MKSTSSGWEKLQCKYFAEVGRRALNTYFEAEGFKLPVVTSIGGLQFNHWGVFIEISYQPESAPTYAPTLIIGIGESKYDIAGRPTGVPLWYVIPANLPARGYSLWTFSSEEQLLNILLKIRAEVLEPFAKPLWQQAEKLENLIGNFRAEF